MCWIMAIGFMLMVTSLAVKYFCRFLLVWLCCLHGFVLAAEFSASDVLSDNDIQYSWSTFMDDSGQVKWDIVTIFAGTTGIGVTNWNWGSSSFRTHSEGWFGEKTSSGGVDKLGHAFSTYILTNALSERMMAEGVATHRAALNGALWIQVLGLYIEVFDGMSNEHGFSREDAVMNLAGGSLAYLRQRYPWIKNAVDYRVEYDASGYKGFDPLADYAGQKYLLAFKVGQGETFLRYVELQAGYYALGFSDAEIADGVEQQRFGFVGVGLNLSALLVGEPKKTDGSAKKLGRFFFEHVQLPDTAIRDKLEI